MTATQTDAIMALADRYAFHIPGSQHSDEARAVLLAALQEQAPKRLWGMAGFNPPLPNVGEKYTSIHEDDLGDHVTVTGIANASSPNIAYVFLSWDDGHYGERAIDEFWQEYMMVQTNDQARDPHIAGKAFCLACNHNWDAVWPMGVTELECPECKRMMGRSTYEVSPHPESRVYECLCGNQLFHVLDDRIHCPNCGQQTGCGDIPWSVK